jgi:ureidoglycolate lyase
MTSRIKIEPLTREAFAPFGDIIEAGEKPTMMINQGKCGRHDDLAKLDFAAGGRAAISVFECQSYSLPLNLELVERHPLGSQTFLPLNQNPFLVIVAEDANGRPRKPSAFMTKGGQGVNYHKGIWHGVLTPVAGGTQYGGTQYFAVVDRVGDGDNLEEYWFETPYQVS